MSCSRHQAGMSKLPLHKPRRLESTHNTSQTQTHNNTQSTLRRTEHIVNDGVGEVVSVRCERGTHEHQPVASAIGTRQPHRLCNRCHLVCWCGDHKNALSGEGLLIEGDG